jgi:hypothetical protein
MTQEESRANLINGCQNTDSTFINVNREHLLIALGAEQAAENTPEATDGTKPIE